VSPQAGVLVSLLAVGLARMAPAPVEITRFRPESGTLAPGAAAVSEIVVRNGGDRARTVWIGYSVQDSAGRWYDVPARALALAPGEESAPQRMGWTAPSDPPAAPGAYRVVMAVWSGEPGSEGAERLASVDRQGAFRVAASPSPRAPWEPARHALGRGRMQPANVLPTGDGFRLRLPAGRCDGAEIRSANRVRYGEFSARMRTPDAPGSLSAIFLYEDVRGGNDEIDLEIHNDGSRRALLTAWIDGKAVREAKVVLPFDPAAALHEYTIRWSPAEIAFLADGAPVHRFTSGIPASPMRLMANAWWPSWLECDPPPTDRELLVESLRLPSAPSAR
jgi:endo-1,3-1,4-beta-glycanase ExoK